MEEKPDQRFNRRMWVHQVLINNGFYHLPHDSILDILKLLDMPQAYQPMVIQENVIAGLLKIIDKVNGRFNEYLHQLKFQKIPKDVKELTLLLLQDTNNSVAKNSTPNNYNSMMHNPYMFPPPMYSPPMGPMPPFPRPGEPPGSAAQMNNPNRYMEQAIKMQQQQMFMQYCQSFYGGMPGGGMPGGMPGGGMPGGMNPMMNPGMGNFMNPNMPSFGGMGGQGKGMPPPPGPGMPFAPTPPINLPNEGNSQNAQINENSTGIKNSNFPQGGTNTNPNPTSNTQGKIRQEISAMMSNNKPQKEESRLRPRLPEHRRNLTQTYESARQPVDPKKLQKKKSEPPLEKQKSQVEPPAFIINDKPVQQKPQKEPVKPQQNVQPIAALIHCPCKGMQRYEQTFLCSICNKQFHFYCLNEPYKKIEMKEGIECYHCRMRFIDPLNKVKQVITEQYITNIVDNKFSITCNLKPYQYLCKQKNKNQIEMRCLKVSNLDNNQITWPDQCIIKLNGQRIIQIPALQMNSSLKKRKDYSIIVTQNIYNNKNGQCDKAGLQKIKLSLEIKHLSKEDISHKKIRNNYTFAFGIYFIEKLNVDELYQKIVKEEKLPEVTDFIQKLMKTSQKEVEINRISVSIYDPYTWDLIKTPVRGNKCQHGQCFDLKTFLSFMMAARNRSWKCPVCNKDARKFLIDSQQLDLINRVRANSTIPSEITFMKDGNILLKIEKESEEEDNESGKMQKSKKISKQRKEDKQNDSKMHKVNSMEQKNKAQNIEINLDDDQVIEMNEEAPPENEMKEEKDKEKVMQEEIKNVEQKINDAKIAEMMINENEPIAEENKDKKDQEAIE